MQPEIQLRRCYWCQNELTAANKSEEHIIPEALGGRYSSPDLLCFNCNNGPASDIDKALAAQLGYIVPLLRMAQPATSTEIKIVGKLLSGEEVKFRGDLRPETTLTIDWKNEPPHQFTGTDDEVRAKALRYLKQKKGQYPEINPEKMLAEAELSQKPVEGLVYFSNWTPTQSRTGGLEFYKGIIKIAVNFYLSRGGNADLVQRPIHILREADPKQSVAKFYYPTSVEPHQLGADEVSNLLFLKADPELGLLYCYVEIYNAHNVIVLLNDAYNGPAFEHVYCYDLLNKRRIHKPVRLPIHFADHLLDYFVINWDTSHLHEVRYKRMRRVLDARFQQKGVVHSG